MALGLWPLIATGPHFQSYLLALLNEPAQTIYGTAFHDAHVEMPDLRSWLKESSFFPFGIVAAFTALSALRQRNARDAFVSASLTVFVCLTLLDVIFEGLFLLYKEPSSSNLFIDVLSNVLGGLAFGVIAVGMAWALLKLFHLRVVGGPASIVLLGTAPLVFGIFCSIGTFYLVRLFYETVPVSIDATVSAPTFLSAQPDKATSDGGKPFTPIPTSVGNGSIAFLDAAGSLQVQWSKLDESLHHKMEIELVDGCIGEKDIGGLKGDLRTSVLDVADGVSIQYDSGSSELAIPKGSLWAASIAMNMPPPFLFNLAKDNPDEGQQIQVFATKGTRLDLVSRSNELPILMSAYLFEAKSRDESLIRPRTLTIRSGHKSTSIKFIPPRKLPSTGKMTCKPLPTQIEFGKNFAVQASGLLIAARVRFVRVIETVADLSSKPTSIEIDGAEGWITAANLDNSSLKDASPGTLKFVQFRGNVSSLDLDGQSRTSHPLDSWAFQGVLSAEYDETGRIRISGSADRAWKNGARANPTRWERLPSDSRVSVFAILGFLGVCAMAVIRHVFKLVSNSTPLL